MRGKVLDPGDENQLWSRFCKGDRAAFDHIYHIYFPQLFQYCARFTTDRPFIQDVLQDFFFDLFSKPPRQTTVQYLKGYLLVAVRRQLFKTLAKPAHAHQSLDEEEDAYQFHLELATDDQLITREQTYLRQAAMQQLVNKLTPRQREAVYLYFYENLPYEQIAEILSLKEVKYARTLIYRALDEMRQLLTRHKSLSAFMR